jgi:acyl-CoA reductase-like NAD-dependent aldehyde dehydrogenase
VLGSAESVREPEIWPGSSASSEGSRISGSLTAREDEEVGMVARMFIAGEWTEGRATETLEVRSPGTGEVLGQVPISTPEDIDAAVRAAREGQSALEGMTFFERARLLHRAAELMEERKEDLGRALSLEQGKPLYTEGIAEIEESAENFRVAAEDVKRLTTEVLPSEDPCKKMFTFRKPNGVYAVITPWNFPFVIPSELVAPGLAGGNACILKPSEYTPLIGAKMIESLEEAGFPSGSSALV